VKSPQGYHLPASGAPTAPRDATDVASNLAGSFYKFFYISHDERTEQKTNRRREDVLLCLYCLLFAYFSFWQCLVMFSACF
jgi:hypothetical protein